MDLINKEIKEDSRKQKSENRNEKIIEFIIKSGLIKKERDTNQNLIRVSKLSRDRFNHNIKSYPDSGDPLSLLDGCLKFCEILSNMKDVK